MAFTVKVKVCVTEVPLFAVNCSINVPFDDGIPAMTNFPADGVKVRPDGGVPDDSEIVGAGVPVAVMSKVFDEVDEEKVTAFALVNTGAGSRFMITLAAIGTSDTSPDPPHELSVETATEETLARLMVYAELVALTCGAKLNDASN